jgi:cytochrome P450
MLIAPSDPDFIADPYPTYEHLRRGPRAAYDEGTDHFLVPRHDDVNALLRDRRLGRSYLHVATHQEMARPPDKPELLPFWHLVRSGILDMEPPDHTRVRALVSKAFTPRFVESLRPRVAQICERLVDGVDGLAEFDLLPQVAEPLPVTVIAEMLGIPESDSHLLRPWSADICKMYELNPGPEAERDAVRASVEFSDYLRALSRDRRAHPGDDLISALTQVLDEGARLTEDELIGTCVLLLNAGHEATVNLTTLGWRALFHNPEQLAKLRADPGLLPSAIEELLRYDTPLQLFERWVLEPVELGGQTIPRGAELGLVFGSANRDPAAFVEPNRLDIERAPNPHVTFGAGVHFCLGAPLARIELISSFGSILRRFPHIEAAEEPRFKPSYIIRGLESMRVGV